MWTYGLSCKRLGKSKRLIRSIKSIKLIKDGAAEWRLAERTLAAPGGVLVWQILIGVKPRFDTREKQGSVRRHKQDRTPLFIK